MRTDVEFNLLLSRPDRVLSSNFREKFLQRQDDVVTSIRHDMRVYLTSGCLTRVPQYLLNFPFRTTTALDEAAHRVAKVVGPNLRQASVFERSVKALIYATRMEKLAVGRLEQLRTVVPGLAESKALLHCDCPVLAKDSYGA
jgi:hypothetical protein